MDISSTGASGLFPYNDGTRSTSSSGLTPAEQIDRLYDVSRNQQELMASLLQGAKIILENPDFTAAGKLLFEKCKSLTRSTCGFITLIDSENIDNKVITIDYQIEPVVGKALPDLLADLRAQAIEGKCSVLENNFTGGPEKGIFPCQNQEIRNILIVPLIHSQTVAGLLALGNKPEDFNSEDVAVAEAFAELLALAWFNGKNLEDLKFARRKAEESDRLKSAFLSNMSHEIRTPLNGILGFSELLAEPDLDRREREQYIRIMNQNGEQLMSIINNILDISLIESGQIVLAGEWVNIKTLIQEVYDLFMSPGLRKKNVHYILDCEPGAGRMLFTDQGRLRQILVNLFGNATKFTQAGHVIMGCRVRDAIHGEEIEIWVEDTGIGIPEEKLDAVFERFRQAENTIKRRFGGTGLGLAISKGLTELLGGRIEVISKPREGSTFRIIFPLQESSTS